jgi:alkanesulfonate monooxygenase
VLGFAAGIGPLTSRINLLTAIRTGEIHPPMLARAISTLDHILKGRLTINIINSDLPGLREDPKLRYQRCAETIEILKQAWTQERIEFKGELYKLDMPSDPAKPYQQNGGPLLYFGGTSEGARDVCARYCDMFLMWPETEESMYETMKDLSARASRYGRRLDFGLRIHVVPRASESEAKGYVRKLMSKFDEQRGREIRSRSEDSRSLGVVRQDKLREELADEEGYIEPLLWTGIGKVFSGCGGALVGDPDQIVGKLNRYMDMGFRSFVFSGFPLIEEANEFARHILHRLPNVSMSVLQGRTPASEPVTPLTTAPLR